MITYKQKEYTNSSDVIRRATESLEKERTYDYEVSDKISKDFISISGNLGNLEIWIPEEFEFSQYSIDDFIREMLPFAYTNVRQESGIYKMSVKGKLTQTQYTKLLRHIIKEAEFIVLVDN
jgi:hypothetical protein